MKKAIRYNGPYLSTSSPTKGRKVMTVYYDDGSKGSTLYARYLMEKHLGRELKDEEHVDHINEDKTDDRIENLQILTKSENSKKSNPPSPDVVRVCVNCHNEFTVKPYIFNRSKDGKMFCSIDCFGLSRRRVLRPSKEELEIDIMSNSIVSISRKYEVSDNTIRKWAKAYGIDYRKRS